jgi:hypothetical protein
MTRADTSGSIWAPLRKDHAAAGRRRLQPEPFPRGRPEAPQARGTSPRSTGGAVVVDAVATLVRCRLGDAERRGAGTARQLPGRRTSWRCQAAGSAGRRTSPMSPSARVSVLGQPLDSTDLRPWRRATRYSGDRPRTRTKTERCAHWATSCLDCTPVPSTDQTARRELDGSRRLSDSVGTWTAACAWPLRRGRGQMPTGARGRRIHAEPIAGRGSGARHADDEQRGCLGSRRSSRVAMASCSPATEPPER